MIGDSANTNPQQLNIAVGSLALGLREQMQKIQEFAEWFNKLQLTDVETLFGLSAADATQLQTDISYMANVAGCYYGTIQQGGSGGTGAILFNFDSALAGLWGGQ